MPARMQVDLLRVLQEGTVCPVGGDQDEKVDVRFVAASHKPLDQLVARGQVPRGPLLPPERGRDRAAAAARAPRRHPAAVPALPAAVRRARRAAGEAADARGAGASSARTRCRATCASSSTCCCRPWCWSRGRSSTPTTSRSTASGARHACRMSEAIDPVTVGVAGEPRRLPRIGEAQDPRRARGARLEPRARGEVARHPAAHVLPPPAGAPDPVGSARAARARACLLAGCSAPAVRRARGAGTARRSVRHARRLPARSTSRAVGAAVLPAVHRGPLRALGHRPGRRIASGTAVRRRRRTQHADRDDVDRRAQPRLGSSSGSSGVGPRARRPAVGLRRARAARRRPRAPGARRSRPCEECVAPRPAPTGRSSARWCGARRGARSCCAGSSQPRRGRASRSNRARPRAERR